MLRLSFFVSLLLLAFVGISQQVNCIFQVKNHTGQNAAFIELTLNSSNGTSVKCKTDAKGKAAVNMPNNTKVGVEVGGLQVAEFSLLPKQTGIKTLSITLPASLSSAALALEDDTMETTIAANGAAELTLKIVDFNSNPLQDYEVYLLDEKTKRSYKARTNANGDAIFHVPQGKVYQPVIDGYDGLPKVQIRDYAGIKMTKGFAYEPTVVDEMRTGDTIVQQLKPIAKATTARVLVDVTVTNLQGSPLENESVFIYQTQGNLVYAAQTNGSGKARLLIPKGFEYYIGFKYADRIDQLNYKEKTPGEHTSVIEYSYRGSAAIESFYATAKRNQQGFITEFETVNINRFKEDLSPLIKKKAYGFDVEFTGKSVIPGPLFHKSGLITSDGYWTNRIYCLNETTGQMKWGIQLAENGPSPFVESEDVLLINTESCTIYAIDLLAGTLLWSKWLSPYLYSTPTIANGKVFTVYGNDLGDGHSSNKSVLACFDLKTGAIVWQQWMPDEILGAPVFDANKLYMSCWDGTLMTVDATNGSVISSKNVHAISPPTIVANAVLVATKTGEQRHIKRFSSSNFTTAQWSKSLQLANQEGEHNSAEKTMVAATGRPTVMGDMFFVADDNGISAYALATGNLMWTTSASHYAVGGVAVLPQKVIALSAEGISVFNAASGKALSTFKLDKKPAANPVFGNGAMAVADSAGGLMIVKLPLGLMPVTHHSMWGENATHNAVITQ